MSRIEAVLFDLDDTLYPEGAFVDSGFRAVAGYLAERFGVAADDAVRRLHARLERDGRGRLFDDLLADLGLDAGEEPVRTLVYLYRSHRPRLELPEESHRVLAELRSRGHRLAVVTDGMGAVQRRKMAALGIEPLVDVALCSDELGSDAWKPHSLPYRVTLELLGVVPRAAAYVGDDPAKDFRWPNVAGMVSVQVTAAGRDPEAVEEEDRARYRIRSLGELPHLLDRLEKGAE